MSRAGRLLGLLVVLVVAASVAGCGDDGSGAGATTTTAPADDDRPAIVLDIVGDQLEGGVRREKVALGDPVTIVVTGDSTDQVHVHGYDRYIELVDGAGELTFDALIPGIFEVELEELGRLLIELEVS